MDLQQIIAAFFERVSIDPSKIAEFLSKPAETLKDITGIDLTDIQVSQAVEAITPMLNGGGEDGKGLDIGAIAKSTGDLLNNAGQDVLGALSGIINKVR